MTNPPLRIRIRSDWDSALTYDSLDGASDGNGVFVGRDTLIAPLVAEILEPNKRGTYLISGYRGTGKTTLLIEALRRAQKHFSDRNSGIRLFPLVLNVSEVSASLGNTTANDPQQLSIDAKHLLIALIRTIDHRVSQFARTDPNLTDLTKRAHFAYEKATASKFAVTATDGRETTSMLSRELALTFTDTNVLKTLGLITGAAAVLFEATAFFGRSLGGLHAAAIALAAVCAVSLTAAYKRSHTEKTTTTNQTAFEHDNSLQQLETDLKDILIALKEKNLRTVVVMEELDKINDPEGEQLAQVIRYFKNLFTQAPALFFFLTDKSYFDIVASAIKRARRRRSYAVEHTFFTHRIFVGRPTTDESVEFIKAIIQDESNRDAVARVSETLGKPGRFGEVDQLGRFIRVVLFKAANHLFDLKNELRRFARNEQSDKEGSVSSFLIDEQTFPPEEAALAVFQDLIVEKSRSFEIKGGRAYANETLADSLYAIFNELGSNRPQKIDSFLPVSNVDSEDSLLLDEQLDLTEAARVRDAVKSLVDDLERGRAILPRGDDKTTFTWRDDAARSFRYIRQLQKHEESLIADLQRYSSLSAALSAATDPPMPHPLAEEFQRNVVTLRDALEPMPADAAAAEQRAVLDRYSAEVMLAFDTRRTDLGLYGFMFDFVAQGLGGSVYLVKPSSGDPRLSTLPVKGGLLLAFGEYETLVNDVWSFFRPQPTSSFAPLNRAALVHVIHTTGNIASEVERRREQWQQMFSQRAQGLNDFSYVVDVIALVDPDHDPNLTQVQRLAASLTSYSAWAQAAQRVPPMIPDETPDLIDLFKAWEKVNDPLFHIATSSNGVRPLHERNFLERNGSVVLEVFGPPNNSLPADVATTAFIQGFQWVVGPPDQWAPLGSWLLRTGRVILCLNSNQVFEGQLGRIVEALKLGARVIFVRPESLPAELEQFPHITSPFSKKSDAP